MKKQLLAESAAKLYIEKLMTLENIAQRLNVNERTLRRWKSADKWMKNVQNILKTIQLFTRICINLGEICWILYKMIWQKAKRLNLQEYMRLPKL